MVWMTPGGRILGGRETIAKVTGLAHQFTSGRQASPAFSMGPGLYIIAESLRVAGVDLLEQTSTVALQQHRDRHLPSFFYNHYPAPAD